MDTRPQFVAHRKLKRRASKIAALVSEATPEARKAKKNMGVVVYRTGRTNLNGFFHPGRKGQLLKCKG